VDLSGWYFSDGINFTFPAGTSMAGGAYRVVAQDPAAVQGKFGMSALGPWTRTLNNEGGKSYSVLYRDSVGGGGWLKLKTLSPSATTAWTGVTDGPLSARSERYYRLVTPALP